MFVTGRKIRAQSVVLVQHSGCFLGRASAGRTNAVAATAMAIKQQRDHIAFPSPPPPRGAPAGAAGFLLLTQSQMRPPRA